MIGVDLYSLWQANDQRRVVAWQVHVPSGLFGPTALTTLTLRNFPASTNLTANATLATKFHGASHNAMLS